MAEMIEASNINVPDMALESDRLATFKNWPENAPVHQRHVATNGFYATGNGLEVKCHFCDKCISNWKPGLNMFLTHEKLSPHCPFVKRPKHCGNVEIKTDPQLFMVPYVPHYADFEKRLRSFEHWPISPIQPPARMAEAGFFYTGQNTDVQCFFCNAVLGEWRRKFVPWKIHSIISPGCQFLTDAKGMDFIVDAIQEHEDETRPRVVEVFINRGPTPTTPPTPPTLPTPPTPPTSNTPPTPIDRNPKVEPPAPSRKEH